MAKKDTASLKAQLLDAKDAATAALKSCEAFCFNITIACPRGGPDESLGAEGLSGYMQSQISTLVRVQARLRNSLPRDVLNAIEQHTARVLSPVTVYGGTYATAHEAALGVVTEYLCACCGVADSDEELAKNVCANIRQTVLPDIDELVARVAKESSSATSALETIAPGEEINLSDAEKDILAIVQEAGRPISQTEILQILSDQGCIPSEGNTKNLLASMKRHGILESGPAGRCYQPGWLTRYLPVKD